MITTKLCTQYSKIMYTLQVFGFFKLQENFLFQLILSRSCFFYSVAILYIIFPVFKRVMFQLNDSNEFLLCFIYMLFFFASSINPSGSA